MAYQNREDGILQGIPQEATMKNFNVSELQVS